MKVQNFGSGLLISETDGIRTVIRRSEVVTVFEAEQSEDCWEVKFEMKSGTLTAFICNNFEEADYLFNSALNLIFGAE